MSKFQVHLHTVCASKGTQRTSFEGFFLIAIIDNFTVFNILNYLNAPTNVSFI